MSPEDMEAKLPSEVLAFDVDNGSEFLTHHLWRYLLWLGQSNLFVLPPLAAAGAALQMLNRA